MKSLSLRLLLPLRFLNIAKYSNECLCSAHEDAKIIEVCYSKTKNKQQQIISLRDEDNLNSINMYIDSNYFHLFGIDLEEK